MPDDLPDIPSFELLEATAPRRPLVVASPHSGTSYPGSFVEASRLDRLTLRKSEDCYVQEIFSAAPAMGAPLLHALFPRAYLDVNREPYELDPTMFEDELPDFVNCTSPRVTVGLGTIARVVADGEFIYTDKLRFAEAEARIAQLYRPYHAALAEQVELTVAAFGACVLIDAHSMPSAGIKNGASKRRVDFVLGDRLGTSCHPIITYTAERTLRRLGYTVMRNAPYAGGFTTRHYGRPDQARHCLQIEINRSLYMNEKTFDRKPYLDRLKDHVAELLNALGELRPDMLAL